MKEMAEGTAAAVKCIAEAMKQLAVQVENLQKEVWMLTEEKQEPAAKLKRETDYWVDANGNKWSCSKYTEQQAEACAATLRNCRSCVSCKDCYDCVDCCSCTGCSSCENCSECSYCNHCDWCANCNNCSGLEHVYCIERIAEAAKQEPHYMSTLEQIDGYWVDTNGNRWSCDKYSEAAAQVLSWTLAFCTDCVDCEYCCSCNGCTDCSYCEYCNKCKDCYHCVNCKDCTNCRMCERCENFADSEQHKAVRAEDVADGQDHLCRG